MQTYNNISSRARFNVYTFSQTPRPSIYNRCDSYPTTQQGAPDLSGGFWRGHQEKWHKTWPPCSAGESARCEEWGLGPREGLPTQSSRPLRFGFWYLFTRVVGLFICWQNTKAVRTLSSFRLFSRKFCGSFSKPDFCNPCDKQLRHGRDILCTGCRYVFPMSV